MLDSIKEMTLLHMKERDLHLVYKLQQRYRKAKGFSCVQSNPWKLRSEIPSPGSVAFLTNIPQDTLNSLPCPSTPLFHKLVVLRLQKSSDQITLIDKTFYMDKGKVNFPRLVCSVINVCRIDCSLQRQPHASPSLLHTNEVTPQHKRVHMLWCDLLLFDIHQ